jgi:metal-responsive CopG/Arc/MetJ family transcriptional regulator
MHKSEKVDKRMENEVIGVSRERVSITLPKECIAWIDKKIDSRTYANRSHAIEVLILEAMKQEKKGP